MIETASAGWSPSNELTVRNTVVYYLQPLLPVALSRIRTAELDAFYAGLRKRGGRSGKPLATSTVRRIHSVVRAALEQGVRWGWLPTNPAAQASPGPSERLPVQPPSPEAVLAMLQAAERDDPSFAVFLITAAGTGARRDELLALRWPDISPETGTLTITRAISVGADGRWNGGGRRRRARSTSSPSTPPPPPSSTPTTPHVGAGGGLWDHPAEGRLPLLPRARRLEPVAAGLREPEVPPTSRRPRHGGRAPSRPPTLRGHDASARASTSERSPVGSAMPPAVERPWLSTPTSSGRPTAPPPSS